MASADPHPPLALPAGRPTGFRGTWEVDEATADRLLGALGDPARAPRGRGRAGGRGRRGGARPLGGAAPRRRSSRARRERGCRAATWAPAWRRTCARRFDAVGRVDAERRLARVLPGATLHRLNEAAADDGLHFPVRPVQRRAGDLRRDHREQLGRVAHGALRRGAAVDRVAGRRPGGRHAGDDDARRARRPSAAARPPGPGGRDGGGGTAP